MGATQDTMIATTKQVIHTGQQHLAELQKATKEAKFAWARWNDALHNQNNQAAAADKTYQAKLGKLVQETKTMQKSVAALAGEIKALTAFKDDKKNRMLPMFTATGLPALKKYIASAEAAKKSWDHELKLANDEKLRPKPTGKGT